MKNWKSNLFFLIALMFSLSPILIQIFGEDTLREKNVSIAEWREINEKLTLIDNELKAASKVLEQKTVIDGDQVLISTIDSRVGKIESLFLDKAEIAITIPLLKRDIESLGKDLQHYKESLSTTNNIVLALIGAIVAQLAAVFFFVRESHPNKSSNSDAASSAAS